MAYWDDEEDESDMVELADDSLDTDKYGEQVVQREQQGQALEREFDAMPEPQGKPSATKQIQNAPEKYSGLMDEYKSLQEKRGKAMVGLSVLDGLSQIGQAMAGRNAFNNGFKVKSNMDQFEKLANRPVQDYEDRTKQKGLDIQLQDLQKERDASSPLAQSGRKMLDSRGYSTTPDMATKDLMDLQKLGDPLREAGQRQQLDIGSQNLAEGGQKLEKGSMGLADERALRDKTSDISAFWQTLGIKRGMKPEEVQGKSAWELQGMIKMLPKPASGSAQFQMKNRYNPVTGQVEQVLLNTATGQVADTGGISGFAIRDVKNERTGERDVFNPALGRVTNSLTAPTPQTPEQANQAIPELTKEQLPVTKQKQLDEYRKQFLDDTKDERAALQAAKSISGLLDAGKALNGDIIRAVQNKFAIGTGNKGATSEPDVTPFGGRQAIVDRIARQANMWINGKFTDDDRKFLKGLAGILEKQGERELKQSTRFFSNNLYNDLKSDPNVKATNITPESVEKLLGTDVYNNPDMDKIEVISTKTGKKFFLDKTKVPEAKAKGLIK